MRGALLDTCVLWPSLLRDFLLSLAIEGLYRPRWSSAVLAELKEHETRKLVARGAHPEEAALRASRLVWSMRKAFDDSCIVGWEPLEGRFGLPDLDDEHLVAAAVVGEVDAIVTYNLRDLPVEKIPPGIRVLSPIDFAIETVRASPASARRAIIEIARRSTRPVRTEDEILDILAVRYGLFRAVEEIRAAAAALRRDDYEGHAQASRRRT